MKLIILFVMISLRAGVLRDFTTLYRLYNHPGNYKEFIITWRRLIWMYPELKEILFYLRFKAEISNLNKDSSKYYLEQLLNHSSFSENSKESSIYEYFSAFAHELSEEELTQLLKLRGGFLNYKRRLAIWAKTRPESLVKYIEHYPGSKMSLKFYPLVEKHLSDSTKVKLLIARGKYREAYRLLKGKETPKFEYLICLYRLKKYRLFLKKSYSYYMNRRNRRWEEIGFLRGKAYEKLGLYRRAEIVFLRLIKYGGVYFSKKALREIIHLFQKKKIDSGELVKLEPLIYKKPYLGNLLGLYHLFRGKESKAFAFFKLALKVKESRAKALFWLYQLTEDRKYVDSLFKEFPFNPHTFILVADSLRFSSQNGHINLDFQDPIETEVFLIAAYLQLNDIAITNGINEKCPIFAAQLANLAGNPHLSYKIGWFYRHLLGPERAYPVLFPYPYLWPIFREMLDDTILLFAALIREESHFYPLAISRAGAVGLAQVMPATYRYLEGRETRELFYPAENLRAGFEYFKMLLKEFSGNPILAVAAYNAGPGNVKKWIKRWKKLKGPDNIWLFVEYIPIEETRRYVFKVMGSYRVYKVLLGD